MFVSTPHVATIEAMLHDGASFEHVEDYIEELEIPKPYSSDELKTCLWLIAWSQTERDGRPTPELEELLR